MYVVGADLLRSWWDKAPAAEGPLRALYALLCEGSWSSTEELAAALGLLVERGEDGVVALRLPEGGGRVRLKANCAAGVIRIESVDSAADEGADDD
jgi:hypothetical protein